MEVADEALVHLAHHPEAGDEKLSVRFYLGKRKNEEQSAKAGYPVYEDKEFVEIKVPGDKWSVIDRPVSRRDRQRFADRYRRWKDGVSAQGVGLPLSEWPGCTRSQVEALANAGVHTVEQLATVPDSNLSGIGAGAVTLKRQAADYLARARDLAPTTALNAELEKEREARAADRVELEKLRTQQAEMAARMERLLSLAEEPKVKEPKVKKAQQAQ